MLKYMRPLNFNRGGIKIKSKVILLIFLLMAGLLIYPSIMGRINREKGKQLTINFYDNKYTASLADEALKLNIKGDVIRYSMKEEMKIFDGAVGDISMDGKDEVLILIGNRKEKYAQELIILQPDANTKTIRELYRNNIAEIKPWCIQLCQLDGEDPEIFIGVHKSTFYYEEEENRPFFFNFRDGRLVKKWTGSKLRSPFKEIYFADINDNGRDELIVIEEAEGGYLAAIYYWFGFGFVLQAESKVYSQLEAIEINGSGKEFFLEVSTGVAGERHIIALRASRKLTDNCVYYLEECD